jgi:hypothetical protein
MILNPFLIKDLSKQLQRFIKFAVSGVWFLTPRVGRADLDLRLNLTNAGFTEKLQAAW